MAQEKWTVDAGDINALYHRIEKSVYLEGEMLKSLVETVSKIKENRKNVKRMFADMHRLINKQDKNINKQK